MKIKFQPTGQEIEAQPGESLLKICSKNQIEIRSVCHGVPSCAECRVRLVSGEHNVLPPNKAELALIGTSYYIDGRRLSCQVRAYGDITVDLSEQIGREDLGTKKMKGAKALGKGHDLKAIQSTLLLEKVDVAQSSSGGAAASTEAGPGSSSAGRSDDRGQARGESRSDDRGGGRGDKSGNHKKSNQRRHRK